MQPEQQQRIMGYFIEEAKDHLNTIEQGVLNLQSTIEDQEMVNELFRAAHSVKGGAAMLGLNSIQQVSHRLEDYFKILKESPIRVDQKLEGLFLQVFDALQELVGQLQGPFGLTDETAKATVAGVEPVFSELEKHLNVLASNAPIATAGGDRPTAATRSSASTAQQDSAFILLFQNDIPLRLREMLQLFKQSEADATNRQQLQELCRSLISVGEQFDLPGWCALVEMARAAIANPDNAYRTLAPIVIRDIKQGQELVLSGRASEITPGAQLQALLPIALPVEDAIDDFADLLTTSEDANWLTEAQPSSDDALFADLDTASPAIDFSDSFEFNESLETVSAETDHANQHGPEVGMAELNSLADLFEGEVPDLGSTWQEEEVIADSGDVLTVGADDPNDVDLAADFSDLLFDEPEVGREAASTSSQDALTDLFSDDLLQPEVLPNDAVDDRALPTSNDAQADLNDLFTGSDLADLSLSVATDAATDQANADFDNLFGDSAFGSSELGSPEFGSSEIDALSFDTEPISQHTAEFTFDNQPESNDPAAEFGDFFVDTNGEQDLMFSDASSASAHQPVELNLDDLDAPFATGFNEQMLEPIAVPLPSEAVNPDPWDAPELPVVTPAPLDEPSVLSFVDDPIANDTVTSDRTSPPASGDQFGQDDFVLEELSDQDNLDFSSLLHPTTDPLGADSQPSLELEAFALEELTDDGLDPSIASWLNDDAPADDAVSSERLLADTDLEAFDQSAPPEASLFPPATVESPVDLSDPWAASPPEPLHSTDVAASDPSSLDASTFDIPTPEALSLDFNEFDFNTAASTSAPDLESGLDIDFGSFGTDDSLDANLLDPSDDWLSLEDSAPASNPVEALGDPFAAIPDAIANPIDALNESLFDNSLDQSDLDVFAFDAPAEPLTHSFDDFSVAQPPELTDNLGTFFDQPDDHLNSLEDLPEDLLDIGVTPELQAGNTADALSDELLGLADLNELDDFDDQEAIAPANENLVLNADQFGVDEPAPTEALGVEATFDPDALSSDLFALPDTAAASTEAPAIETSDDQTTDIPDAIASESSFSGDLAFDFFGGNDQDSASSQTAASEAGLDFGSDAFDDDLFALDRSEAGDAGSDLPIGESLDFGLLEDEDLDNALMPQTSNAETSLDLDEDLFALDAPEIDRVDTVPPTADSLDFGDDILLDFDAANESNGVAAEGGLDEDFSLNFGSADFDALRLDSLPVDTHPVDAEALFEDASSDFAWESSGDAATSMTSENTASEGFSLDFDGSDSDSLGFDSSPEESTPMATDSLFEEATPENAASEGFSLDFDDSDSGSLDFDSSPAESTPMATESLFEEATPENTASEDFSLDFDGSDFDSLGFDSSLAESTPMATDSLLEAALPEAVLSGDALSDFDWEGGSAENASSLDELDSLMDESFAANQNAPSTSFDDLLDEGSQPEADGSADFDNLLGGDSATFDDLDNLLAPDSAADDEFSGLEAFLDQDPSADALTELDDFLADTGSPDALAIGAAGGMLAFGAMAAASQPGDFADLESLLQDEPFEVSDTGTLEEDVAVSRASEFDELDDLLKDAEERMSGSPTVKTARGSVAAQNRRPSRPGRVFSEQTMRVPVKHLDNLSNLVGELVVNRNSLEEDQERLRQSLDNLLYQVQQLSDVGQRMQDLYERSLLESSLLASRQGHRSAFAAPPSARESGVFAQTANATGIEYDPLEMDRFTGFHSLSQEMIELIVRVRESSSDIEFIVDETDQVTRMFRQVTTQLQEGLTRSRMVPFAQTADRLPRAVRDIAMKVGKQAELSVEGRETLIDKMILEQLYDPMTHLVNNAITHGIESPEVRRAAGKPASGRITIRAFHQGNQTIISVSDDGAGIDIDRVKAKAIEKGLITATEARNMSRLDVYDLLFHAGFSTKDQADDFSGRGVGMDVVRTSLSEIRGAINTDSTYGKGTTFTIRLPLTLSISKALCCISDRARIAFPMDGVEDMLDVPKERIQTNAEGQACIPWRDSLLPLRPLSELLSYSRHLGRGNVYGGNQEDDIVSIVVLRSAGNFLALQVDQVLGEQEIVIKQLEGPIPKPVGVAGATVLGDGRIMPIADVLELIDLSMGRIRKDVGGSLWEQDGVSMIQEAPIAKTEPTVLIVDDSITVRELLSMTFNKVGYRVEQARDGQEAWEKLRAGLPCDIVFCDIEMPRMDGLELLSRIQKDPTLNHLPIAMLTSRGADRHRQMAVSLGASGYFTKPYLEEALLDAAQRMLKGEVLISNSNA